VCGGEGKRSIGGGPVRWGVGTGPLYGHVYFPFHRENGKQAICFEGICGYSIKRAGEGDEKWRLRRQRGSWRRVENE